MTDEDAIAKNYAGWIQAYNRSDLERLVALYADDVVLSPPGGPELEGREAVREWIQRYFESNRARQTQVTQEVEASGDWGWLRGRFEIEISERRTGPFETIRGAHLMIWRRKGNGWRIFRDIWNLT